MTEAARVVDWVELRTGLPPEWSADVLRARYSDLAGISDDALLEHYRTYGRAEGRVASDGAPREGFVALIPADTDLLEIGPFCQPVFAGPRVRYLDVLDAESLRERGAEIGLDLSRTPEVIHFTNGLAEAAGSDFSVIFSSHNIEHQPDLLGHLHEAAAALAPGGLYMLIVPDKRYCFDHFIPETNLQDVIGAHVERRTVHTASDVIEHRAFTCHNDMLRHWQGDHGPAPHGLDGRIDYALNELAQAAGGYVDVHAWQFTPDSFRKLLTDLHALGLSPFRPVRVYDAVYGRNEFTAALSLEAGV